ncbi:hypothetical protein [Thermosulfuriphilus sp.]
MAGYPLRYICLSDLHLGEEDGLLTNLYPGQDRVDPQRPSPVLKALSLCLGELVEASDEPPSLIILGDGLELALSSLDQAAMVFERLLEVFFVENGPLFKEIIYLPGNHDHHIWEVAREVQYADYVARSLSPGPSLPQPWHHSRMLAQKPYHLVRPVFLEALIRRFESLKDLSLKVAYPNFALLDSKGRRIVCFHHGHLIEPIYLLMSILKKILFPASGKIPRLEQIISEIYSQMNIDQIEAENFAWIDFFWSTMGRSGEAGQRMETIYEKLQALETLKDLIDHVAQAVAQEIDIPYIPGEILEKKTVQVILEALIRGGVGQERHREQRILSSRLSRNLSAYLAGPVAQQIQKESGLEASSLEMTFVFGHTHKPFLRPEKIDPYLGWTKIYNTGGWVVDRLELLPIYGANLVLVDADLNVAALRMFVQGSDQSPAPEEVRSSEAEGSPLFKWLAEFNYRKDPWRSFIRLCQDAAQIRAAHLRRRAFRA